MSPSSGKSSSENHSYPIQVWSAGEGEADCTSEKAGSKLTFFVPLSCGLNGALYFVSMDEDGGMGKYSTNKAGAKYGTGYCDAQCPRDLKFINGEANSAQWKASSNDQNAGVGQYGSCCTEMDVWEANSISTAYTPHPCSTVGQHRCEGDECGGTYSSTRYAGTCDPDGCDYNSYRQGVKDFYGPGLTVDTKSKFTVVTQFIKGGDGVLSEIKRYYVQNGKLIPNSQSTVPGTTGNSVNPDFCKAQKVSFGDGDHFADIGGFAQFSKGVAAGMVLVMSLWDDHYANMLWLDSTYPTDASPDAPGKGRGSCDTSSGVPKDIESSQAANQVIYCKTLSLSDPTPLPPSPLVPSLSSAPPRKQLADPISSHKQPTSSSAPSTRPSRPHKRRSTHPRGACNASSASQLRQGSRPAWGAVSGVFPHWRW